MIIEEAVTQIGFPIAVVIYLLYERGTTTKELTKAITKLESAITKWVGWTHGKV